MYGFSYENQGSNKFLVYHLEKKDKLDQMAMGMLSQNRIPNLLPVSYTQIDSERYLRYSGLSMSTLNNLFGGIVTRDRILTVLDSICDGILHSEEYLLEGNFFILDTKYMYVDSASGEINLVYLPILNYENNVDYTVFFKEIITNVISDPQEDGTYITKLLYYLNSTGNFSISEFSKIVKGLKVTYQKRDRPVVRTEKPKEMKKTAVVTGKAENPKPQIKMQEKPAGDKRQAGDKKPEQPAVRKERPVIVNISEKVEREGYTFDIPNDHAGKKKTSEVKIEKNSATEDKMSMLYLLRNFSGENLEKYKQQKKKNEESKIKEEKKADSGNRKKQNDKKTQTVKLKLISMNPAFPMELEVAGDVYHIGRKPQSNHGIVPAQLQRVSREHCTIIKEKNSYFVVDRKSSYGTIVDGEVCKPGEKSKALHNNSVIELPDLAFRVELY